MATSFDYTAAASTAPAGAPVRFDYAFAYEDRGVLHTSRWSLEDVRTVDAGNTDAGWLWLTCQRDSDTATLGLFKDAQCGADDQVASAAADVSAIDAAPVRCVLTPAVGGISGELYLHRCDGDAAEGVAVLVTLCTDADLREQYQALDDLPAGIYDATAGLARYCAAATRKTLLLASQRYALQLGGFGAPEHATDRLADRTLPDYRRIANVDQLKDAAVHWALQLAFGSCHQRFGGTLYSELRDYHDRQRRQAVAAWNLAFNTHPDTDGNADAAASAGLRRLTRL